MTTALTSRISNALSPLFTRDPFTDLQKEMDDLIQRFQAGWNGNGNALSLISPSVDLSETADAVQLRVDVPGFKAEEINVEVSGDTIHINGEHKEEKEEKGKTYHRLERRRGSFARTLTLPAAVKDKEVKAEVADGVLTVTLPKTEVAKTQKITVKAVGK